ncbi:MAG: hypothetical protein RJB38_1444 [Pseudomonadota bacterium]|jgi:predicted dehydrogenase
MTIQIQPLILGRGMAGQAMAKASAVLSVDRSLGFEVLPPQFIERGALKNAAAYGAFPLLMIANPHGLHAKTLVQAQSLGFSHAVLDKPVCTTPAELAELSRLSISAWICHGYRQFWGPQRLKALVEAGDLGRLFAIEGRYWQSSAAQRATGTRPAKSSWKNDLALSGGSDVALDLLPHWMDMVLFLAGDVPRGLSGWKSFVHAEAPHRDTHLHLSMQFSSGLRSFGSISKTAHGSGNFLEIHLLGERASASWSIERADEILMGFGGEQRRVSRAEPDVLGLAPFHGAGWLAGYTSVIRAAMSAVAGNPSEKAPVLSESLTLMKSFFEIHWETASDQQ